MKISLRELLQGFSAEGSIVMLTSGTNCLFDYRSGNLSDPTLVFLSKRDFMEA